MDTPNAQKSTYGHLELREAVGDLFFVWSDAEQAIRNQIKVLDPTSDTARIQGISRWINHLKKLHHDVAQGRVNHILAIDEVVQFLSDALEDRNLIAHGIRGWHGNIDHDAAILVLELDQRNKELSLASLRSTTRKLSFVAFQLSRLTFAALHPDKPDIDNIYEDIGKRLRIR
jgi:hypothetical protein